MTSNNYKQEMEKNGYIVVKNAFSPKDVARLREILKNYFRGSDHSYLFGGLARPDAFNAPELREILVVLQNDKIAEIIKQIAGEDAAFCNHSDAHCNLLSGWHKDNSGYGNLDEWKRTESGDTYGVYKVALYLEEHVGSNQNDSSLKVRNGSHLTKSFDEGEPISLYTQAGDAIIFDCRVTHMGLQDILLESKPARVFARLLPLIRSESGKYKLRSLWRKLKGVPDRYALFYVFGRKNEFTANHIAGNTKRQREQNAAAGYTVSPEIISNLEKAGIQA